MERLLHSTKPQNPQDGKTFASGRFSVRTLNARSLDAGIKEAWAQLETRSLEGNAYLSPHFVIPALQCLTPQAEVILVVVERENGEREGGGPQSLAGLGVFEVVPQSRLFLQCHLKAYKCVHSYVTGVLLDRDCAPQALHSMLEFLVKPDQRWSGIEFADRPDDGPLGQLLNETARSLGIHWFEYERVERPVLVPAQAGEEYLNKSIHSRTKDARRRWRRLQETGEVVWRHLAGPCITPAIVDQFLDLESKGWKQQNATSLRSSANETAFFKEMTKNFAEADRALFTELSVGGRVIASTSNFSSGRSGFAFKLGWEPEFATYSPGLLNELELIRTAPVVWNELDMVDSGAAPGSFMENIWLSRRTLASGMFTWKALGKTQLAAGNWLRQLKKALSGNSGGAPALTKSPLLGR